MDPGPGYFLCYVCIWSLLSPFQAVIKHLPLFVVLASVILTQWRTRLRRQMNERDIVSTLTLHAIC